MKTTAPLAVAMFASGGLLVGACADKPAVDPSDATSGDIRHSTSMVNATAVIAACPDGRKMRAKTAADAINRLVEPCAQVPGGKAHFAATLLPGGKIELASPEGKVADGVVPTCVLSHGLSHKVFLTRPCTFDVQLEERKMTSAP